MSKVHENTVTDVFADVLRENNINALTQLGASVGHETPDILIKMDDKSYLCEAEWNSSKFDGLIQADSYSKLPESSGSFLILYPDSIKTDWEDSKKFEIHKYKFRAYFFRSDQKSIPSKLCSLDELVIWIKHQIQGKEVIDISELIDTLRELVALMKDEMPIIEENMSVFDNVLGIQLEETLKQKIAQYASAYLLINQILFYQILSTHKSKMYEPIYEKKLNSPYDLSKYFDKVLDEDYQAIYSIDVVRTLTNKSLQKIVTVIRVLRALALDKYRPDIIGKVFHSLIPLDIRKVVAAYFTKEFAADILASYAIKKGTEKVIDLACGSGTLLVAAYQRKRDLIKGKKEDNKLHKKFVEEDITGLDIMPFSAHLSTINLALQQPLAETNFIRVGIFDSTNAQPEIEILPLRNVIPTAQKQRILEDFIHPNKMDSKSVQEGAISLIPDHQHSFKLKGVDAVMMNPPFTRQESIGKIGSDYKRDLLRKFSKRSIPIDGTSSYYTFFILIADKFIKENGKLSFVLPATILAKETDQAIRTFLLKNYQIDAIIVRSEGFNFSENTTLTEILLLCKKEKPNPNSLTSFITLKNLDETSKYHVEHILRNRKVNEEIENPNYHTMTFSQSSLDETNLFIPVSLSDYSLMKTWKLVDQSKIMFKTEELGLSLDEGLRSRQEGKYPECGLSAKDTEGLTNRDVWVIEDPNEKRSGNILVKHRIKTDIGFLIPTKATCYGLRNSTNRNSFDVSNVQDRILIEQFEEFDQFSAYCDLTILNLNSKWKKWVLSRSVNLAIIETLHPEAPNTYFFSYFSDQPRSFSSKFWNVTTSSLEEAKLMVLWFNSSLNFIQLLINRVPTGWFKIRGYVFQKLKAPSIKKLNPVFVKKMKEVFDNLKEEEFPTIWIQLARNAKKNMIYPTDWNLMKKTFENFEQELGQGFEPRKTLDMLFLDILNLDIKGSHEEFLSDLYVKLLKEICLIKQSAVET